MAGSCMYKFLKMSHSKKAPKWLKLITEFGKVSGVQFVLFLCSWNREYKREIRLQKEAGHGSTYLNSSIWVAKAEDWELKASLGYIIRFLLKKEYLGINCWGDKLKWKTSTCNYIKWNHVNKSTMILNVGARA